MPTDPLPDDVAPYMSEDAAAPVGEVRPLVGACGGVYFCLAGIRVLRSLASRPFSAIASGSSSRARLAGSGFGGAGTCDSVSLATGLNRVPRFGSAILFTVSMVTVPPPIELGVPHCSRKPPAIEYRAAPPKSAACTRMAH